MSSSLAGVLAIAYGAVFALFGYPFSVFFCRFTEELLATFWSHRRCTRLSDSGPGHCGHPCDLVRQRSLPVLECNDRHCRSDS